MTSWLEGPPTASILEQHEDGLWMRTPVSIEKVVKRIQRTRPTIVFADSIYPSLRTSLSAEYKIPAAFWSDSCEKLNGFFGSSTAYDGPNIKTHKGWFKVIVKHFNDNGMDGYDWSEMRFFSLWTASQNTLICFDCPRSVCDAVLESLQAKHALDNRMTMGLLALQAEVLEQIVVLYDTSIWHLARQIRTIEKIRTHDVQNPYSFDMKFPGEKRNNFLGPSAFPTLQDLSGSLSGEKTMATTVASVKSTQRRKKPLLGPSSFPKLHDLARHTAHSTETVHVAADILARILRQGERIEERSRPAREKQQEGLDLDAPLESLGFSHSILCSLTERSKSNEKRLSNEINLMFNLITQRDSKAVQNDSAAMKAIAVVTTLFLPATFLAAIFGMTFFDYSPPAGADDKTQATWSVAPQIWIYFALAAPLTLLSVMVGNFWLKRVDRQFSPAVGTSNPAVIATGLTSEEAVKISGAMPGEEEVEVKLRSLERGSSVARLNGSSMV